MSKKIKKVDNIDKKVKNEDPKPVWRVSGKYKRLITPDEKG